MFETYKLNAKGIDDVAACRAIMAEAVESVLKLMPESREKSLFKTHLETAMFYATRAIAQGPDNHSEVVPFKVGQ